MVASAKGRVLIDGNGGRRRLPGRAGMGQAAAKLDEWIIAQWRHCLKRHVRSSMNLKRFVSKQKKSGGGHLPRIYGAPSC